MTLRDAGGSQAVSQEGLCCVPHKASTTHKASGILSGSDKAITALGDPLEHPSPTFQQESQVGEKEERGKARIH